MGMQCKILACLANRSAAKGEALRCASQLGVRSSVIEVHGPAGGVEEHGASAWRAAANNPDRPRRAFAAAHYNSKTDSIHRVGKATRLKPLIIHRHARAICRAVHTADTQ